MKPISTAEVAKRAGVHPLTLERWLVSGALRWPKVRIIGKRIVRLWNEADVERLKRHKAINNEKAHRQKSPARTPSSPTLENRKPDHSKTSCLRHRAGFRPLTKF